MYQHHNWQGALLDYPVSKVVCVGSNYAKHIKEMGSAVPEEPVLFIKPETALCDLRQPLAIPSDFGSVHHEVELAVLIGATLRQATEEHVRKAIAGYGVAYMSKFFTLKAGDVVLTGTPDGVGPLQSGDELTVTFDGHSLTTRVL